MRRATFYRVSLGAATAGAIVAICVFCWWRFAGAPFNTDLWIWFYPASMMLMLGENASAGAAVAIVATTIATNAALYFIAASALCGFVVAVRGGLRD